MQYVYVGIVSIVVALLGLAAVMVMSRLKFPIAWIRKLSHLGSMTLVIVGAFLFDYKLFVIVGIVLAVLLTVVKFARPPKALKGKEARASYGEIFFLCRCGDHRATG